MASHATATAKQYDQDVGRPKKPPEEKYETPRRGFRPNPPEIWPKALAKVQRYDNLTVTDILNHALEDFLRDDWEDWR